MWSHHCSARCCLQRLQPGVNLLGSGAAVAGQVERLNPK
jgi:hypothetical protein